MAVAKETMWTEADEHIETMCEITYRLSKLGTNLRKTGRANYSVRLLEEKLDFAKTQWKELNDRYTAVQYYVAAENDFHEYMDLVSTEIDRLTTDKRTAVSVEPCNVPIELPKQRIPKFGGDPREWEHFEDLFTAGVINNAALGDIQRLYFLNACLEGPAAAIVASLPVVGRNFTEAWTRLKTEFGLPRIVTGKLLDKLLYLKPIDMNDLSSMQQVTVGCTQAIAVLDTKGTPEQQRDWLLAHWVKQHFTPEMELEWQKTLDLSPDYPTFEDVRKFVDKRSRALLSMNEERRKAALGLPTKSTRNRSAAWKVSAASKNVRSHNVVMENVQAEQPRRTGSDNVRQVGTTPTQLCGFCNGPHSLPNCRNFAILTAKMRSQYVKGRRWCIQCLGTTHTVTKCKNSTACTTCGGMHHSLLHFEVKREAQPTKPLPKSEVGNREEQRLNDQSRRPTKSRPKPNTSASVKTTPASTSHCTALGTGAPRPVLLATARVKVFGKNGTTRIARALLDQGSETSFISASLVNDLKLARRKTPATVTGLGGDRTRSIKYSVGMSLGAKDGEKPMCVADAYVVPQITTYATPSVGTLGYEAFLELPLADPDPASDQTIEILIGADLYAQIMRAGFRRINDAGPIAQETAFGWVISGPTNAASGAQNTVQSLHCTVLESLDQAVRKFWEMEEIPATSTHTKAEEECEAFFQKTVTRDETGRFVVRLPLNCPRPEEALGNSFHIALSALTRLRKKLDTNPTLGKEYAEFLAEYESLGHMSRIEPIDQTRLYIPHRAVIRTDSATTKLRVVFNATSRTVGGRSLNDILHYGMHPKPNSW
ncbi:uncharacterized protein LOC143341160 [Colletes latitarsis]|uniref:uncharacterized protein LOC143341160 n=1 Tax=Colletes latitarsis TaxID=2605962 RepID=UPI004035014F